MNAIHIIMATSSSANPHNAPNEQIENIVRKRKMSAVTFLGELFDRFPGECTPMRCSSLWYSIDYRWIAVSII